MRPLPISLVCCTLATSAFAQTTWYVDLAATPPGDGSQASPYVSIQQAIDGLTSSSDTVLVAPGEYFETLTIDRHVLVRATAGPTLTVLRPAAPSHFTVVTLGDDLDPPTLEGFTIRRDGPGLFGNGVRIPLDLTGRLVGCIVTGHSTGVANSYDLQVERSTITGNAIGIDDGGIAIHQVSSSIVRGNSSADIVAGLFAAFIHYSDVGGIAALPCVGCLGNIDLDPRFWNAQNGDYRLRFGSPCIDAGDPGLFDPDGSRLDMGALPYDPTWAPGTGTSCFGDALTCPCGNGGSGDGGCDIPQATGGIELAILNFAPDGSGGGTAQFLGTGYSPNGQPGSTLIRSPALEPAPVVFGDGLRCITATGLVRVGALVASGGTSLHTISHGAGAGTFHYQVWVRSQPAGFCNPEAFNLSNVVSVTW